MPAVLFVHVPPFAAHGGPLADGVLLDGAEAIIRFALAFARQEVPVRATP
jgi:hypothetical protein